MNLAAIIHRPSTDIYPSARDALRVQLTTAKADVQKAEILYWLRYETSPDCIRRQKLTLCLQDALHDTYRAAVRTGSIAAYVRYCFHLQCGEEEIWLGAQGMQHTEPPMNGNFFEFLWPNEHDGFLAPSWRSRQIYYQIFPERFKNGDPARTPVGAVAWGSAPTRENYMGGDLAGIIEGLDHICSLGATCLYLTPIFKATSNHKYDTTDYFEIDPCFGTKQTFRRLVQEVHRRGMRIILDGVFNHCGYNWPPFQDVVKNGRASDYCDWFFLHSYPVQLQAQNYDCVGHYKWMPKLNLSNPQTRDYFLSVGRYWLSEFEIDGWRLDVADEMPTEFLSAFAAAMYEIKPDCILLGETWGDAQRLVRGDRLDSAMNYLFRDAAVSWLARREITASQCSQNLSAALARYPLEVNLRMYNLLDSHDTARFLYDCGGDETQLRLAAALQMTFPGNPAIFYGDEVGLSGENDPGCRLAMQWDESRQNSVLFDWYRRLIRLRLESSALTDGEYRTGLCSDGHNAFTFTRATSGETALVLINAGDHPWQTDAEIPSWAARAAVTTCLCKTGQITQETYDNPAVLADAQGAFAVTLPAASVMIYQYYERAKMK